MPFFRSVFNLTAMAVCLCLAPEGIADDLSDLLKQTEDALTKPQDKPAASVGTKTKLKQSKNTANPPPKKNSGSTNKLNTVPKNSTTSQPILGPADAASVNELIKLGASREAQLNPNKRQHILGFAIGNADLKGTYEVTKDDDVFKAQDNSQLQAILLHYSFDLFEDSPNSSNGLKLGTVSGQNLKLIPLMGLNSGYLRGKVQVERSGIQSGAYEVEYSVIPAGGHIGIRTSPVGGMRVAMTYGLGMDMLLQTGKGQSDSTSGFFTTDHLNISADYSFSDAYSISLYWKSTGFTAVGDTRTKREVIALGINAQLAG